MLKTPVLRQKACIININIRFNGLDDLCCILKHLSNAVLADVMVRLQRNSNVHLEIQHLNKFRVISESRMTTSGLCMTAK